MALTVSITKGSSPNTMRCAAGEPMLFSFQDTRNYVPLALNDRAFVYAVYAPGRVEVGYFDGGVTNDERGPIAYWEIDGALTEEWLGQSLRWELSDRGSKGRTVVATGVLTIDESAPRIDNLADAPAGQYIARITRDNTAATSPAPDFKVTYVDYVAPALGTLSLAPTATYTNDVAHLTIVGRTIGSTIVATSSDGTALTVDGSTVTGFFTHSGAATITLVETLVGSSNSPKTSTMSVTLVQLVTLKALTLDATTTTAGTAFSASIIGKTSGSTIVASASDGTVLTLNGEVVSGTFASAGSPTITLMETIAGSVATMRVSTIVLIVSTAVSSTPMFARSAFFSTPFFATA